MVGAVHSIGAREKAPDYEGMLRDDGRELVSVVAAIADAPDSALVLGRRSAGEAGLIVALTLLAAGIPVDRVASQGSRLRSSLDDVDAAHGIEFYLLSNGLTIAHFHALRERLDAASDVYRGDVA